MLYSHRKNWFTLAEVLISTFVSTIILWFIFLFLSNIAEGISKTKDDVLTLESFYDFSDQLDNYRNVYISWSILVDNTDWSDVFLMTDWSWENWILVWPVSNTNNRLNLNNTIYESKTIWFRKLSSKELQDINNDLSLIYDYIFQDDKLYNDLKIQDLILISYNSWKIFDMSLIVNTDFNSSLIWRAWSDLDKANLKKFNINF